MTVAADIQALSIQAVVELFELSLAPILSGGGTLYFVADVSDEDQGADPITRNVVLYNGNRYYPVPLEVTGLDRGGSGAVASPTLRIGDVRRTLSPWVWGGQDLTGATITRRVVLRDNLDDGSDPDPTADVQLDVFEIEQKVAQVPTGIEFRLIAAIDQGRRQLPGRPILRDSCRLRYRVWTGSAFDYSKATCPYVGTDYFDKFDSTTTASGDRCSRRLSGCILRFPDVPLPISAFPGVGRTR